MSAEVKNELKIPIYPSITSIKIDESVLNTIIKLKKNPKTEGLLFGRETVANEIQVTSAIPLSITDANSANIISYLEINRLDYIQVGFFFCNEQSCLITEANMKAFIAFQKMFPNAVILNLDINMFNANCYPFKCFRLNQRLMELVDMCEIEEEVFYRLQQGGVQEENQNSLFKKNIPSNELLHMLSFSIIEDKASLFCILFDKKFQEEDKRSNSNNQPFVYSINRKIIELNKNCEKFIEEQKKFIDYFKVKKTYGKKKEREFLEFLSKKGNELANFNKAQISINSKNIYNMNQQLNSILNQNEINNHLNLKLLV